MRKSSNWPLITVLIITVIIGLSPMIIAELPNKIIYLLTRDGGVSGSGNATSLAGTNVIYTTDASVNDVLFFDGTNWNVGPVTASSTNATFGAKTNGTTVTASASILNFIYGSNVVIRTTNAAGQVDIQISATATGGGSTNDVVSAHGNASITNNAFFGSSQQWQVGENSGFFQIYNASSGSGAFLIEESTDIITIGDINLPTPLVTVPVLLVSASNNILGHLNVGSVLSTNGYITTDTSPYTYASSTNGPTGIASREIVTNIVNGLNLSGFSENTLKIYLETNGVDSTAVLGDPSKPFGTLAAAATNIVNNSALIIGPGSFNYVPTINTNGNTGATLTTPIVIERKTNVTIAASGPSTLFESGTNWGEFISIREGQDILIKDFTLKNRRLTGPEHGTFALTNRNWSMINFYGTNANITIEGIHFKDITRQAISHLFGPRRTTNVLIQHNFISGLGVTNVPGAVIHDGAFVAGIGDYWTIQNNYGENMFRGVEQESSSTPTDTVTHVGTKVLNNVFRGLEESGFDGISPYKEVLISGNTFEMINDFVYAGAQAAIKLSGYGEYQIVNNKIKGGDYGLYSEVRNTNWLIQGNMFLDIDDGIALLDVNGTGAGSHSHMIKDNYFIRILNRAIHVGGRDMFITGNHFIDCQYGATANQGIIRIIGGGYSTNITVRNNFSRNVEKTTTNLYVVELGGGNHVIEDNDFRDYATGIYFSTAPGTTFGFNDIPVNSATAPTDNDVLTYISALNIWTNQPSGSSGEVNVLGDSSVTNATTISLAGIKSGSTLNLKTVRAGSGIVVTNEGTNVVISSTGVSASTNLAALFAGSLIASNNLYVGTAQQFRFLQSGGYFQLNNDSSGAGALSINENTDEVIIGTAGQTPLVTIPMLAISASNNILGHLNVGSIVSTNGYVTTDASPYTYASSTNGPAGIASREIVTNIVNAIGGSGNTNFIVTTTDHGFVTNLYITGTGPGTISLSNSTGSSFVKIQMSDAGTSKTNAFSFSTITDGQSVTFNGPNGTMTNEWVGQVADAITTNGTVIGLLHSRDNGTNYLKTITAGLNVTITNNGTNLVIASSGGGSASAVGGSGAIQFADGTDFYGTNSSTVTQKAFHYHATNGLLTIHNGSGYVNVIAASGRHSVDGTMLTNFISPRGIGTFSDGTDPVFSFFHDGVERWEINEDHAFTPSSLAANNLYDIGSSTLRVGTNYVVALNARKIQSPTFSAISQGQVLGFHDANGTLTNLTASGSSGPTTNAPPYTVPITGTNFIIDWRALGATNDIVLTNYAAAGILNTNIIPGKVIRARIDQGSQGFQTIVPNTNYFGPNWRYTSVQTGITQSTNGGYEDFIVLYGSRTNAVLSGQNWGAAP